jgi:hypothetical protein
VNQTPQHSYPNSYQPGTNWATDEAWKILDALPPGRLTELERAYLAGLIAGTLLRCARRDQAAEIANSLLADTAVNRK